MKRLLTIVFHALPCISLAASKLSISQIKSFQFIKSAKPSQTSSVDYEKQCSSRLFQKEQLNGYKIYFYDKINSEEKTKRGFVTKEFKKRTYSYNRNNLMRDITLAYSNITERRLQHEVSALTRTRRVVLGLRTLRRKYLQYKQLLFKQRIQVKYLESFKAGLTEDFLTLNSNILEHSSTNSFTHLIEDFTLRNSFLTYLFKLPLQQLTIMNRVHN